MDRNIGKEEWSGWIDGNGMGMGDGVLREGTLLHELIGTKIRAFLSRLNTSEALEVEGTRTRVDGDQV